MQSLADIFRKKSFHSPLLRSVNAVMTIETANHILSQLFGEKIIDMARAVYIKNRALTIACLSTVAAQEIKLNEAKIINLINKKTQSLIVDKIRYII